MSQPDQYILKWTDPNGENHDFTFLTKYIMEKRLELKKEGCTNITLTPADYRGNPIGKEQSSEDLDKTGMICGIVVVVLLLVVFIACQCNFLVSAVVLGGVYVAWLVIRAIFTVIKYWNC